MIRLLHPPGKESTVHPASINEKAKIATTGATYRRRTDHPRHLNLSLTTPPLVLWHLQHVPGDFGPINLNDAVDDSAFPRRAQRLSAFEEKGKADLGIGKSILADHVGNVTVLGRHRLEEFSPRRYGAEQVSHGYRRPLGSGLALANRHLPLLYADIGACGLARSPGQDVHLRHRGDAGQGFSAKAKGGN